MGGILLILALSCIYTCRAQEIYENSSDICGRCKCLTGPQFVLDCRNQAFHHVPAEWPQHNTTLTATFTLNNITTLEVLPDSDLVKNLMFDHCSIQNLDNGAFKAVKNVVFIDLSHNLLTTEQISAEKFKGPYNDSVYEPLKIKYLNLAYNKIHSLPHNVFEHLSDLEELNLEGNHFKFLDQPTQMALSGLPHLETLNLARNDLTELVEEAIHNLDNLVELNLAYNKIDFVPDTLSLLEKLETVYLDYTMIFELTDESFLGVKSLREISLTNLPRLSYVKANTFAGLSNLKILKLSDNRNLATIDREAFAPNQILQELYLHNNSLRDLDFNLTHWTSLRLFTLDNNPLICDCDLFAIGQQLSWEITREKDGPLCLDPVTGQSKEVYHLKDDVCLIRTSIGVHLIESHFFTIRIVLISASLVLCLTAAVAIFIAFLRYRRYKMNLNYPFATQVIYNPLKNPGPAI
ncbi:chondroadherin-like isoform X2 [Cylas formicarius]|uniref:chondroadherin-like isoform X2 n=1 Tax=Cylas formicarius TaxID=197179 RepID=UPI0029584ACB|nr:chondroadherin-like isoform X2 [Cylas formicarius]